MELGLVPRQRNGQKRCRVRQELEFRVELGDAPELIFNGIQAQLGLELEGKPCGTDIFGIFNFLTRKTMNPNSARL